ncbi:Non-structural maintenance of chromosome element 3 [Cytospora mali]|uniref:Non-structural maintenance of chromosome element 3 n=1 Tax=Cytospora mali TaxID=578113 RepID=A0A194VLU2_CYTMA|nr:Non-structural maintenance of chromosome element 3 [Valsa mali]
MPPAVRRSRQVVDDEEEEQRPRQRQRHDEPDSYDDAEEEEEEDDNDQVDSVDGLLIKKLVRYAMACDFNRVAIRRDGIKEKVLGDQGRAFRRVFEGAQQTLRSLFGMQMVELPVRDKVTKEEKPAKSQSKSVNSNAYVLVSVLPDAYRTSKIIAPSKILSDDDEAAFVAFYTMIISLIRINGGELSDPKLKRYLRRLNAETNSFHSTKTEDTLAKLQRQGYLVKNIDKDARQHSDEQEATTWLVGPRGKVEVSDEAIAGLVRAVWGEQSAELESRLQNSLNIQERDLPAHGADGVKGDDSRMDDVNGAADNGEGPSRRRSGRRRHAEEEEED